MSTILKPKITVSGTSGLLGWHIMARMHAANMNAVFLGLEQPYDFEILNRCDFTNEDKLSSKLSKTDILIHCAGATRGEDVEEQNVHLATRILKSTREINKNFQIIYANTTQQKCSSKYGMGKHAAAEILATCGNKFTNVILPNLFGEYARPFHNNVTATFIKNEIDGNPSNVNRNGVIPLAYVGDAAAKMVEIADHGLTGTISVSSQSIAVPELAEKIKNIHQKYSADIFPYFSNSLDIQLFNSYRSAITGKKLSRSLQLKSDSRGTLFETAKASSGGQVFMSVTHPGITRGDHFHMKKIERFVVIKGQAKIRIRKILQGEITSFEVDGNQPTAIDMPTYCTHSIENTGQQDLITMFWTDTIFDPANPDTFYDNVRRFEHA